MLPFQGYEVSELPVSSSSGFSTSPLDLPEAAQGSFCQAPPMVARVPFLVGQGFFFFKEFGELDLPKKKVKKYGTCPNLLSSGIPKTRSTF